MSSPRATPQRRPLAPAEGRNVDTHETGRRKVRKGTHSCWECKRRKMKCIFDRSDNVVCNGCRRRGSRCTSQEYPEEASLSMETAPSTPADSTSPKFRASLEFPKDKAYINAEDNQRSTYETYASRFATNELGHERKYARLSHFLHSHLPSRQDTETICKASQGHSILSPQILTTPYTALDQHGLKTSESLLEIPDPDTHPVLIARYMLQLAIVMLHLHPGLQEMKDLREPSRASMERLVDVAINCVTTKEDLLGSIEGLECVMTESMYQARIGNLRRSWLANRRAMGIAQLMGLNRAENRGQYLLLDPTATPHPQLMWFRILFLDRHLSLMLGLSQGSLDRSIASEAMVADVSPVERLERIHCVIASRILERNESNTALQDMSLTHELDMELQRAARSLPSKWWLAPYLDGPSVNSQTLFWDMHRIFAQVLHYNLLNQLHLPYMLHSSTHHGYEYSKIICVNASREVLSRFITLRNADAFAYHCRIIDFLALMAAMTLLLAHLDSHRCSGPENPLAHQYQSDRAMIERAQENMEEVSRLSSDALSAKSADLLRRLLAVETEEDDRRSFTGRVSVQGPKASEGSPEQDSDGGVSVHVPYFGVIKIAREGVSRTRAPAAVDIESRKPDEPSAATAELGTHISSLAGIQDMPNIGMVTPMSAAYSQFEASMMPWRQSRGKGQGQLEDLSIDGTIYCAEESAPQSNSTPYDTLIQHESECPGLAAGGEEWAFQGVDVAFFDSLMKNITTGE